MRIALKCNGPNKLEKISFSNIVALKISAIFECDSTNISLAATNLDTVRFYQKAIASLAVQGRFKRNREGKYLEAVEKMRQGKRKSKRKKNRRNLRKE